MKNRINTKLAVGICTAIPLVVAGGFVTIAVTNVDYSKNYSAQTVATANLLAEMNKNPRCTSDLGHYWNLDKVREFIHQEALKAGVEESDFGRDTYGNMWFDVKATEGCDNWEPLILQGHMDMVVTGLPADKKEITPIDTVIDWKNGIMHSRDYKTTLGADDGAGLSMILALIQDPSVKHGPLRVFCSADEDSGMLGAAAIYKQYGQLDWNPFKYMGNESKLGQEIKYLLNIDAEDIGEVYASCAGSITYKHIKAYEPSIETKLGNTYSIDVENLKGGHSGDGIVENRANAEKMIYEILYELVQEPQLANIQIVKHYHPSKDGDISFQRNAIVSHARVVFNSDITSKTVIENVIKTKITEWSKQYTAEDWSKVSVKLVQDTTVDTSKFMSATDSLGIIKALGPNDAPEVDKDITHLWYGYITDGQGGYTKSANLSPVEIKFDQATSKISANIHSQTRTIGENNFTELKKSYENFVINGEVLATSSEYRPWELKADNQMVKIASQAYKDVGIEPKLVNATGGVEPTWWIQLNKNLQCSCIGPTITDAHAVEETLHLKTVQPVLNAIKKVMLAMETAPQ